MKHKRAITLLATAGLAVGGVEAGKETVNLYGEYQTAINLVGRYNKGEDIPHIDTVAYEGNTSRSRFIILGGVSLLCALGTGGGIISVLRNDPSGEPQLDPFGRPLLPPSVQ